MAWGPYTVAVKVRGTENKRPFAVRKMKLYADSYGDAIERAQQELLDITGYEVKKGWQR